MCDPSGIIGGVISGATVGTGGVGPFTPSQQFGSFLGKAAPIAGNVFDVFEERSAAKEQAKAIGKRAGQIEFDAKLRAETIKEAAERRLGGQKGRFAKAGIKATGSAKRLLEEQIKQDELDLLKSNISRDVMLDEERRAARQAGLESSRRVAQALTKTAGSLFDLAG